MCLAKSKEQFVGGEVLLLILGLLPKTQSDCSSGQVKVIKA